MDFLDQSSLFIVFLVYKQIRMSNTVKADDKIPNIAGIKFPTYNRTIVSTRGAMVHDYERGIFYDQRDV
ncbi:hypothetical protein QT235_00980 [Geobacillus stearothermophilus]|nr:hypothetical protein QT235_00980 [Geobacillus stearothermophilus]